MRALPRVIGIAAACALASVAGCTSGGARPLAPVAPVRPVAASHAASRVVLSPKTGQPVRRTRTFATGVDSGRAWRVGRHSLRIFDVRDVTTTRVTLPGPVRGPRIDGVDVGPGNVVIATAGIRNIEIYSRPLSRHGRWHAAGLCVHGRLQQRQTPHLYLSDRAGTVAVLADYGLGMTVAQNFLFLSHDGGMKFHPATAPPGMLATNLSFLNDRTGFAVEGSIGVPAALFRTDDGARSWHPVQLPGTRRRGERVEYGRPAPGRGSRIVVPVQRGDNRSRVMLYVSTDGGRTFRPTTRHFTLAGPAHGGLPFDIGPDGPHRLVTIGGDGLVATIDGHTWHRVTWFHPPRDRLHGKYAADLLETPDGRHVFVQTSGYPNDDHSNRPEPWTFVDRSRDQGSSWHSGRARHGSVRLDAMHSLWVDHRHGWAYGPELYETTDGGRTWHQELAGHIIPAAALSHDRLIVVAQRCADPAFACPDRPNRIFTASVGGAPQPFAAPRLPAADVMTIYRATSGAVDAVLVRYRKRSDPRFDLERVTAHGTTPRRLRLPAGCTKQLLKPEFDHVDGTLWFACQTGIGSTMPQWGRVLIYQSRDDGRTWIRTSEPNREDLHALEWITPVDRRSAWAVTEAPAHAGGSLLWHTINRGRTWYRVRGVPRGSTIDALTTPTATSADVTVRVFHAAGSIVRLLRATKNGRHTRVSAPLPVPDNLPR